MAAEEAIDVGKSFEHCYRTLRDLPMNLIISVDSKDLYSALSTQRLSTDKAMRGEIGIIRYEFEIGAISEHIWIPGKLNTVETRTKFDSTLVPAVHDLLQTGRFLFDFDTTESCISNKLLGSSKSSK